MVSAAIMMSSGEHLAATSLALTRERWQAASFGLCPEGSVSSAREGITFKSLTPSISKSSRLREEAEAKMILITFIPHPSHLCSIDRG